jgi:uncharacterized protein
MDFSAIAVAAFGLTIAGIIKGATGLGYASCALPFLTVAVGLKPAMAIVIIPAMATNINVALTTGYFWETVVRFRWLYLSMLPGIAVGLCLLLRVDQSSATMALGFIIVGYVLIALARPNLRIPERLEVHLQWPTGFLNGVMTGLTGAQVMPLFPYVMALQLEPARTVQAINLSVMIASTILAVGLAGAGLLTISLFAASVAAVVPALVGVEVGMRMRRLIPVERFRRLILVTLLLIGVLLVLR